MTAIIIGIFAGMGSFIFLNRHLARAVGGSIVIWQAFPFDIGVGLLTYLLVKGLLQ